MSSVHQGSNIEGSKTGDLQHWRDVAEGRKKILIGEQESKLE